MDKIERYAFPMMIGAAVIGIWAAFRNGGASPTIVQQTGGVSLPALQPLQQVLPQAMGPVSPAYTATAPVGQPAAPIAAAPVSPATIAAAVLDPWATGIKSAGGPPAYLVSNFGPALAFSKPAAYLGGGGSDLAGGNQGGGGCGCQKPKQSCVSPCDENNARYPDGRSGCLVTRPSTQGTRRQLENLVYLGYGTGPGSGPVMDVSPVSA